MSRYIFLLNRGSGGNERGLDADQVIDLVKRRFQHAGHDLRPLPFPPSGIMEAIRRAMNERPNGIIAGGGDGTVSAVARALGGGGITLGVLPMGTFNLAARDFGVPMDIDEAARFLATEAREKQIDVLDVNGRYCLCMTLLGFYPAYARTFERRDHGGRWWRKAAKVVAALPRSFRQARPLHLRWQGADIAPGGARTKFCAFVPGRVASSVGLVPTRSTFQSGKLTAYIGLQREPAAAVRAMIDFVAGKQEENPELVTIETPEMTLHHERRKHTVSMIDGEVTRLDFPIQLRILPKHLRVLAAPDACESGTAK
ncbi:MAG: hypothetical protein H7A48_13090 [Akkermansiaceae bacterium]|nr:hypothetical protein [Akkermansiaceae bacterium]